MARRHGPLFESLTYDKAPEADRVIRPQAADSHQGARSAIAPATGRIDSCIQAADPKRSPCGGRRP